MTPYERFLLKVHKTNTCWLWTGARTKSFGYAWFRCPIRKQPMCGHRWVYEWLYGALQRGAEVRHTCDTPACVNPKHLIAGTHADNMRDVADRKRGTRGPRNHHAKLTWQKVRAIRQARARGVMERALAMRYGVARQTIQKIKAGVTWKE